MKLFYMLDDKLVETEELEPERDVENEGDNTIIVNTFILASALKRGKG
jgi:hypothetical protein